jgi:hypothetical protein
VKDRDYNQTIPIRLASSPPLSHLLLIKNSLYQNVPSHLCWDVTVCPGPEKSEAGACQSKLAKPRIGTASLSLLADRGRRYWSAPLRRSSSPLTPNRYDLSALLRAEASSGFSRLTSAFCIKSSACSGWNQYSQLSHSAESLWVVSSEERWVPEIREGRQPHDIQACAPLPLCPSTLVLLLRLCTSTSSRCSSLDATMDGSLWHSVVSDKFLAQGQLAISEPAAIALPGSHKKAHGGASLVSVKGK